jgi:hypothetical protein
LNDSSINVKPVEGDVVSDSIMPNFIRPMPPGGEWHEDEVLWINHTLEQPLKWNSLLCTASVKITEVRTLLEKALMNSLTPSEQAVGSENSSSVALSRVVLGCVLLCG